MQPGRFNRRVTIQQQSASQDTYGQPVLTWTDFTLVWADVRYTSGLSAIRADAQTEVAKVSVRVRWCVGIKAGMRVLHGLETYNILSVLPDMQGKQYVDLVCEVIHG